MLKITLLLGLVIFASSMKKEERKLSQKQINVAEGGGFGVIQTVFNNF